MGRVERAAPGVSAGWPVAAAGAQAVLVAAAGAQAALVAAAAPAVLVLGVREESAAATAAVSAALRAGPPARAGPAAWTGAVAKAARDKREAAVVLIATVVRAKASKADAQLAAAIWAAQRRPNRLSLS